MPATQSDHGQICSLSQRNEQNRQKRKKKGVEFFYQKSIFKHGGSLLFSKTPLIANMSHGTNGAVNFIGRLAAFEGLAL